MKPISIEHGNRQEDGVDVVVNIALSAEDKETIYKYHMEGNGDDYDIDDVSMLVWIFVDNNGEVHGYSFDEASYYPSEQGETYYPNDRLPKELEYECIEFVKNNPGYTIY